MKAYSGPSMFELFSLFYIIFITINLSKNDSIENCHWELFKNKSKIKMVLKIN